MTTVEIQKCLSESSANGETLKPQESHTSCQFIENCQASTFFFFWFVSEVIALGNTKNSTQRDLGLNQGHPKMKRMISSTVIISILKGPSFATTFWDHIVK